MRIILQFMARHTRVISFMGCVALLCYAGVRIVMLCGYAYRPIDLVFHLLLAVGEAYVMVHAFGYMLNTYIASCYRGKSVLPKPLGVHPAVAVVVVARHEPKELLEKTIITLKNLDYDNKTIYLLDDSSDLSFKEEARALVGKYGIRIFNREKRHGAKAGIINDFLLVMQEKYLAIFDADQQPMPHFLKELISFLEQDERAAFIQTPQFYTNTDGNLVAESAEIQQAIFYEIVAEGKYLRNSMFCCGTNVIFRVQALHAVGGFDESSITEDFATSFKLHCAGYTSVYHNHVCVFGMAPEGLGQYLKQQSRWACGTTQVLTHVLKKFFTSPRALSIRQWWEYFLAGTYYCIGWAFLFFLVCPLVALFFNIPTQFFKTPAYILTFIPYLVFTLGTFLATLYGRGYSLKKVYQGLCLVLVSFPILMQSVVYGIVGKKVQFVVTSKEARESMPYTALWPQMVMIVVHIAALWYGMVLIVHGVNLYPVIVNMLFVGYNLFVLTRIFRFNTGNRTTQNYTPLANTPFRCATSMCNIRLYGLRVADLAHVCSSLLAVALLKIHRF